MTIFRNAVKWAFLFPIYILAAAGAICLVFAAGYGLASFVTDDANLRVGAAFVAFMMAMGAVVGAREGRW